MQLFSKFSTKPKKKKKKRPRLVVDGNLAKNKIIELALQLDAETLKLLKSPPKHFISNKQFLPNSFTQYKNKIKPVWHRPANI
jgi:hypothetical protein